MTTRSRVAAGAFLLLPLLLLGACSRKQSPAKEELRSSPAPRLTEVPGSAVQAVLVGAPPLSEAPSDARKPDKLLQTGHVAGVTALAFSPDGRWLASAGGDQAIILWNAVTGREQLRLAARHALTSVSFSPDGKRLASAASDGVLEVWNVAAGAPIYALELHRLVRSLLFSPDGQLLVVGLEPTEERQTVVIAIFDANSGKQLRALTTDWDELSAMVMSTDGLLVASGSAGDDEPEGHVQTWNLVSGQVVRSIPFAAAALSPDGRLMASLENAGGLKVMLRDVATGKQTYALTPDNPGRILFSPDGEHIVVAHGADTGLEVWSVTGEKTRTMPRDGSASVNAMAFSPDGKRLAAAPYSASSIKIWDFATGHELTTLLGQGAVTSIVFSPDGRWLVSASSVLTVWDVNTGKASAIINTGPLNDLAFSPDGAWLAGNPGRQFPGETLKVWNTSSWTEAASFAMSKGSSVFGLAFGSGQSPPPSIGPARSRQFASAPRTCTVWSASSALAASLDGKFLATTTVGDGKVVIWDANSGQPVQTIPAHTLSVAALAFSRDSRWLVTVGQETPAYPPDYHADFGVRVWDTLTWKEQRSWRFSPRGVPGTSLTADGTQLAATTGGGLVRVFDVSQGGVLRTFSTEDAWPGSLEFSPDGGLLAQGAQNGTRIWQLRVPEPTGQSRH